MINQSFGVILIDLGPAGHGRQEVIAQAGDLASVTA